MKTFITLITYIFYICWIIGFIDVTFFKGKNDDFYLVGAIQTTQMICSGKETTADIPSRMGRDYGPDTFYYLYGVPNGTRLNLTLVSER